MTRCVYNTTTALPFQIAECTYAARPEEVNSNLAILQNRHPDVGRNGTTASTLGNLKKATGRAFTAPASSRDHRKKGPFDVCSPFDILDIVMSKHVSCVLRGSYQQCSSGLGSKEQRLSAHSTTCSLCLSEKPLCLKEVPS
ncbi:hypothetical protein VTO42DRAFT_3403 [Malbranchea cinnamomea]